MKKIFKILTINFLLLIGLFLLIEGITYYHVMKITEYDTGFEKVYPRYHLKFFDWDENYPFIVKFNMRKPFGLNYKNKPIVIFGCSYAYGYKLQNEQTFGYKLSEFTKRPIYNRADSGLGIQHMLYQLTEDKSFYENVPEPEYVIFVYINHHRNRLYYRKFNWFNSEYLSYVKQGDDLVRWHKWYAPIFNLYSVQKFFIYCIDNIFIKYKILDSVPFAKMHFIKSKEAMEQHWKKTKFVILNYDDVINQKEIKELEKNGFKVVNLFELEPHLISDVKYRLSEVDKHPSEKAWDMLVPKIASKLKL